MKVCVLVCGEACLGGGFDGLLGSGCFLCASCTCLGSEKNILAIMTHGVTQHSGLILSSKMPDPSVVF